MKLTPFIALLHHQLRMLMQNRSAALVLLMFIGIAAFGSRLPKPANPVCYLVYWQEDAWIETLKDQLPEYGGSVPIEIAPVERFVNEDGLIEYPSGAHSIQLRPPSDDRDSWVIWFWYSGAHAEILNPAADWFWSTTHDHIDVVPSMHVRVSSLGSGNAIIGLAGPALRALIDQGRWKAPAVWVAIVFCGCYLPAMALAQQRENQTLFSLIATPVGWTGVELSTGVFYFVLAVIISSLMTLSLGYRLELGLVATILLTTAIYIAIGFTLGCWCSSVASASAGLLVYLTLAGVFAVLVQLLAGLPISSFSVELQFIHSLQAIATAHPRVPLCLVIWYLGWFLVARWVCRSPYSS